MSASFAPGPVFDPPAHPGEVGTFGRYRVLKQLGQGGMGAVFLGYDASLERKIALKVMLPQFTTDAESRERFLREARSAAKVKSDHVVTIHDVGEVKGVPFIAMEYLLGAPLDRHMHTKGELTLAQAVFVARQTALGLAAVHELGLVHRDIKPGNLWLEAPKGRVKLLDFGLARAANDNVNLTGTGAVVGTVAFMSPEQGRGLKVDHRSDLFSLGVLLYRMTTGKMPFTGDTVMALLTSLAVDTPVPPRQHNPLIPEALEAVITKLLAKNPNERFPTAQEVAGALLTAGSAPTGAPAPGSLAVGAQTQNVWEGIDDSGSVAVPLDTDRSTDATRVDPARAGPKPVRLVAGGALVAVVVVAAVVALWPKKKPEVVKEPEKPPASEKKPPPKVAPAPISQREAAEWVLRLGGMVQVNDENFVRKTLAQLPPGNLRLTGVRWTKCTQVTDEDLIRLKDCPDLTQIYLEYTQITDKGLEIFKERHNVTQLFLAATGVTDTGLGYFKECRRINALSVYDTGITDAGLAHFDEYTNVQILYLGKTGITDAGLGHFRLCSLLRYLQLKETKVTDRCLTQLKNHKALRELEIDKTGVTKQGITEFADVMRKCWISWNEGVIEPREK